MNNDGKNTEDSVQELSPEELLHVAGAASTSGGYDDGYDDAFGVPDPPGPKPRPGKPKAA